MLPARRTIAVALVATITWLGSDLPVAESTTVSLRGRASVAQVVERQSLGSAEMNVEEIQLQIEVTTKELRAATDLDERLARGVELAAVATEELEAETGVVATETLKNAIEGYRHGETPQGILSSADLTASMRATALGGAAVSADTESFDVYRDLRKDLEIEQAELEQRRAQSQQAAAARVSLESRLAAQLDRFAELEEQRLQRQAAQVTVQAANRAQARGRKQGFYLDTCPVNGPHEFIDSWGFARSGGRRHKGVDILAVTGTPVVAPVAGRVEHFSNSVGGRSFRLFDLNGNYYYGTHLSGFAKDGDVRAGEVIGYVGDDGNAAGIPHLHFEIHPGGRGNPINPFIDSAAVCSGEIYT
ncbi:MAG: M23 family metallopeptidase [Actinomycetota bacterium]